MIAHQNRVIVIKREVPKMTRGGLHIPDTATDKPCIADVVSVGEGKFDNSGKRIPMDVLVGDAIVCYPHAGKEIVVDGVKYHILEEIEVIAIYERSPK